MSKAEALLKVWNWFCHYLSHLRINSEVYGLIYYAGHIISNRFCWKYLQSTTSWGNTCWVPEDSRPEGSILKFYFSLFMFLLTHFKIVHACSRGSPFLASFYVSKVCWEFKQNVLMANKLLKCNFCDTFWTVGATFFGN